jgi:hypothetical protein
MHKARSIQKWFCQDWCGRTWLAEWKQIPMAMFQHPRRVEAIISAY